MKAVIQRVSNASVTIEREETRSIERGLVVLLGVMQGDGKSQAELLAKKIVELRIFQDDEGKMNRGLLDIDGHLLVISNFTLGADCKKGRRPSFIEAAPPVEAEALYRYFLDCLKTYHVSSIQTGEFGAHMDVDLCNDGPITIIMDTKEWGK